MHYSAGLICYPNASSQWAPLNPVLVARRMFKRTQANPLYLPEILIPQYALISLYDRTIKMPGLGLNSRPVQPDSHAGYAHCSAVA